MISRRVIEYAVLLDSDVEEAPANSAEAPANSAEAPANSAEAPANSAEDDPDDSASVPPEVPDVGSCEICCTAYTRPSRARRNVVTAQQKIECKKCAGAACAKCVARFYDTTTGFFPKCIHCGDTPPMWDLVDTVMFHTLRRAIGNRIRAVCAETATRREKNLVDASRADQDRRVLQSVFMSGIAAAASECHLWRANSALAKSIGESVFAKSHPAPPGRYPDIPTSFSNEVIDAMCGENADENADENAVRRGLLYILQKIDRARFDADTRALIPMYSLVFSGIIEKTMMSTTSLSVREVVMYFSSDCSIAEYQCIIDAINIAYAMVHRIPVKWWTSLDTVAAVAARASIAKINPRIKNMSSWWVQIVSANITRSPPPGFSFPSETMTGNLGCCDRAGCIGIFLGDPSTQTMRCIVCSTARCLECTEQLEVDAQHKCNADTRASIREIRETTKPCPGCAAPTQRVEGCKDMFCTVCKQAYNWITLQPVSSNTNPEFHAWVSRVRASCTNGDMRAAFAADAVGEDGLTIGGRIRHLYYIVGIRAGLKHIAEILSHVGSVATHVIPQCVDAIPNPGNFADTRMRMVTGAITEDDWLAEIADMEVSIEVARRAVFVIDTFVRESIDACTTAYRAVVDSGAARDREEIECLHAVARNAVRANAGFGCIIKTLGRRGFKTTVFTNAAAFLAATEGYTGPDKNNTPSTARGGFAFAPAVSSERTRIARILKIAPIVKICAALFNN